MFHRHMSDSLWVPSPSQPPTGVVAEGIRIWLVEDSPTEAAMIAATLASIGTIEAFSGGAAMLERLATTRPDVLVLDWQLPDMSGLEICEFVRGRLDRASLPIVMLTALSEKGDLAEALRAGANDYVAKPFHPTELVARVENAYLTKSLFDRARRAEDELKDEHARLLESEAQLRRLADSGLVGIVRASLDGRILGANAAFLEMIGQNRADVAAGQIRLDELTPSEWEGADRAARRELEAGGVFATYEKELLRADGSRARVLMGGARLLADGAGIIAYVLDISSRRAAEIERERTYEAEARARSEAERASKLKDEFLATVSHELRTPLNAIVGWSDLLRNDPTGKVDRDRALETIARNARAQSKMIEDILDVSRIVSGHVTLEPKRLDAVAVAAAALDAVSPLARAKNVTAELLAPCQRAHVVADPDRLQQVMTNLLTNAVKFTPVGGRVDVLVTAQGQTVSIRFSDTGQGISEDLLPNVFERFRQADSSSTRRHSGLGLGLSIARHIVELHGGTISAESAGLGLGATFCVELPLSADSPDAAGGSPTATSRTTPALGGAAPLLGLRVLLVDDTEDSLEVLSAVLGALGCAVVPVRSCREALDAMSDAVPDVLITDLAMPDDDGFTLVRLVRERSVADGGAIPVVAVSAYAREEDRDRALSAGFQAHLAKPVNVSRLLQALAHLPRTLVSAPLPGA